MAEVIVLPKIGVNMVEASIVEWGVTVGDAISKDDLLAFIETDKATQEIYSPQTGTVLALLVELGQLVQCQEPIAVIGKPGENIDEILKKHGMPETINKGGSDSGPYFGPATDDQKEKDGPGNESKKIIQNTGRVRISPLVKKIAKENRINLDKLSPSVSGSRITKNDVLRFLEDAQSNSLREGLGDQAAGERIPLTGIRRTIANRMSLSNQNVPSAALSLRVDAAEILKWKEAAKKQGIKIGPTEIIIKALTRALKDYPMMNSRLDEKEIIIASAVNIGVAVDTDKGLLVPVIKNAAAKGVNEISRELESLVSGARDGSLSPDDMTGGTFTITNLGTIGIEQFIPVVNYPEAGILAVGVIRKEVVVAANIDGDGDTSSIKPLFWITLAFDHRIVDGAYAGKFLVTMKDLLEYGDSGAILPPIPV